MPQRGGGIAGSLSEARWFYAPTGRKVIAQGKAKRRPGIRYATIFASPERAKPAVRQSMRTCSALSGLWRIGAAAYPGRSRTTQGGAARYPGLSHYAPLGRTIRLRISARSVPSDPQLHRGASDEPPTAANSASLPPTGRQNVLCSRPRPRSKTFMNACNFVDYTTGGSHCESRMREICTYGLTRRKARPVRPSSL
jgi:hypothetical protein